MQTSKSYLLPIARLLISSLFIWDGVLQLGDPSGTARYFANVDPDIAIWISIPFARQAGTSVAPGSTPPRPDRLSSRGRSGSGWFSGSFLDPRRHADAARFG
jgi:hypothetical protein